ncbi:hypothetical protein ACS0TY_022134 [Phlomoides rotata]
MTPVTIRVSARATTGPSPLRIRAASKASEKQPLMIKIRRATTEWEAMDSESMNVITRSMSKDSQSSSSKDMNEDSLLSHANEENNSTCSTPHSSPVLNAVSAIVTDVATFKDQKEKMASMMKTIEELTTRIQSQDAQITKLLSNANNTDTSRDKGKGIAEEHYKVETFATCQLIEEVTMVEKQNISSNGFVPIDHRNDVDANNIIKDITQDCGQRKLSLKEMQQKQYPFMDSNVPVIFDKLLQ